MKEKRTYTHLKEHGEDISHENEVKLEPLNDRGISLPTAKKYNAKPL